MLLPPEDRLLIASMNWRPFLRHGRAALSRCFWSRRPFPHVRLHAAEEYPFREQVLPELPREVASSFSRYAALPQEEYVGQATKCWLEPETGYVVAGARHLIAESLPYAGPDHVPDLARHLKRIITGSPRRERRCVASLRDVHEGNYFHFYNDVLARIRLFDATGHADLPLVVGKRLYAKRFFQEFLASSTLKSREWIVQDDEGIEADRITFGKAMPHSGEALEYIRQLTPAPRNEPGSPAKLFVTRTSATSRYIVNHAEVEAICRECGYAVVDCETMSVQEQIGLFANARCVAGVHGAALTNILYRGHQPLSVLEIFEPSSIPPHYFWIAQRCGFHYAALVGSASDGCGFHVPGPSLRDALRKQGRECR